MSLHLSRSISVLLASSLLVLTACSKGDAESKTQTQVAARVNKEEISVHQINSVLARTPNITPEQVKPASRQVLEKLIDQQLLVEQAKERKLDRDPNVLQQLENARREILARAYLEQVGAGASKPSTDEARAYFGKHPELFSERRIYNFNEITLQNRDGFLPELQQQLSKARSIADVAEWLKQKGVQFNAATTTKAAEQLPIELLPKLHQMKDGQLGVLPVANQVVIIQLAASRTAPIEEKAAIPAIEQYMQNQRKVELIGKEVKSLREKAKIEYQGEFTAPAAAAPAAAAQPEKAVSDKAETEKRADQAIIEKGLASIK